MSDQDKSYVERTKEKLKEFKKTVKSYVEAFEKAIPQIHEALQVETSQKFGPWMAEMAHGVFVWSEQFCDASDKRWCKDGAWAMSSTMIAKATDIAAKFGYLIDAMMVYARVIDLGEEAEQELQAASERMGECWKAWAAILSKRLQSFQEYAGLKERMDTRMIRGIAQEHAKALAGGEVSGGMDAGAE